MRRAPRTASVFGRGARPIPRRRAPSGVASATCSMQPRSKHCLAPRRVVAQSAARPERLASITATRPDAYAGSSAVRAIPALDSSAMTAFSSWPRPRIWRRARNESGQRAVPEVRRVGLGIAEPLQALSRTRRTRSVVGRAAGQASRLATPVARGKPGSGASSEPASPLRPDGGGLRCPRARTERQVSHLRASRSGLRRPLPYDGAGARRLVPHVQRRTRSLS
jgi:hypothetical protein